jgi:hypothetical protein
VSNNVIDWNASWECNTTLQLLGLLAIKNFLSFLLDKLIGWLANWVNISANNRQRQCLLHGLYKHVKNETFQIFYRTLNFVDHELNTNLKKQKFMSTYHQR